MHESSLATTGFGGQASFDAAITQLAGIDLLTGQVHVLVRDRHRSREFIEFLKLVDAAYPTHTAIKLILDNHSAHISKETKAWLAKQPVCRFDAPSHPSRFLAQSRRGLLSKLTRSVRRQIRVASKQELKDRTGGLQILGAAILRAVVLTHFAMLRLPAISIFELWPIRITIKPDMIGPAASTTRPRVISPVASLIQPMA
jgi:hypothetical protein